MIVDRTRQAPCVARKFVFLLCLCIVTLFSRGSILAQAHAAQNEATIRRQFTKSVAEGSRALQQGDNAAAESAFRQALSLDPASVELLNNLPISVARQGRDGEAISLYLRALNLRKGDPITERNLGVAYFRAHRYQDALPLLESFAKSDPTFQSLDLTGLDLFALDRYAGAATYLERASQLQRNDLPTLDILGKAYWRAKSYAGVTQVFNRIMAINPDSPEAHFMLGLAYDVEYQEQNSMKEFQAVLKVDPDYPGIHSSLGLIDWREHNVSEAKDEFVKELDRDPKDTVSNYMLGQILWQQEKPSDAVPYLTTAVAENPSYRDALFELGQCYLSLKEPAKAVKPLKKATEVDPEDAQAHFVLARALSQLGRSAEAAREREICRRIQAMQHNQPGSAATTLSPK